MKSRLIPKTAMSCHKDKKTLQVWQKQLFLRFFVWDTAGIGMKCNFFLWDCSLDSELRVSKMMHHSLNLGTFLTQHLRNLTTPFTQPYRNLRSAVARH